MWLLIIQYVLIREAKKICYQKEVKQKKSEGHIFCFFNKKNYATKCAFQVIKNHGFNLMPTSQVSFSLKVAVIR
jgi:hypothetical protein